jgi:hypothetical protein
MSLNMNEVASAVARAVFEACQLQVEKSRSLDNLNIDVITSRALADLEVDPWGRDDVQFPRLLAEISATQDRLDLQVLAESMDISVDEVNALFDRADTAWEAIKARCLEASACPQEIPREGAAGAGKVVPG